MATLRLGRGGAFDRRASAGGEVRGEPRTESPVRAAFCFALQGGASRSWGGHMYNDRGLVLSILVRSTFLPKKTDGLYIRYICILLNWGTYANYRGNPFSCFTLRRVGRGVYSAG